MLQIADVCMIRPVVALLMFAGTLCAQTGPSPEAVIARAGRVFISEREFLERFELTPGLYRHRTPQLEQEKLALLYAMVAEKLLAQEALDRGLDTTALVRQALDGVTRLLVRDELYRREVRDKVGITPSEIKEGMQRIREQRHLAYVYLPEEQDARFVRSILRTPAAFDAFVPDSSLHALVDTATVIWGDADTTIENAAYRLDAGTLSPIIRAGDGYYILRLVRAEPHPVFSTLPTLTLRERVVQTIRVRKERAREEEFLQDLLRRRTASSPPALYRRVADALTTVFQLHASPPMTAFTPDMAEETALLLRDAVHDTLVVVGSASWTVREVLDRLARRGFRVAGDSVASMASRLYGVVREWTDHELLAQEALARGLDRSAPVQQRLGPWKDHYLSGAVQQRIHGTVTVSEPEVYAYLQSTDSAVTVPVVNLRYLQTTSISDMDAAFRDLERGVPFDDVARMVEERGNSAGTTGWFPITERYPLGLIGSQLEPGQGYGPLRDSTGYLYVQLLDRRGGGEMLDTATAARFERARSDVLRMKQRRAVTLFLAQAGSTRGFEIYSDRLKQLKVSPLPMVAYRLLGFGGRMFDVPFVEPHLEWLTVDPPQEVLLP